MPCCRLVGTVGKGMRAWHADTKRMVAHMRLEPQYPDVWGRGLQPYGAHHRLRLLSAPISQYARARLAAVCASLSCKCTPAANCMLRRMAERATSSHTLSSSCLRVYVMSESNGRFVPSVATLVSRGGMREAVAVEHAHLQARAQLQPGSRHAHQVAGLLARRAPNAGGLLRRPRRASLTARPGQRCALPPDLLMMLTLYSAHRQIAGLKHTFVHARPTGACSDPRRLCQNELQTY